MILVKGYGCVSASLFGWVDAAKGLDLPPENIYNTSLYNFSDFVRFVRGRFGQTVTLIQGPLDA